MKSYKNLSALFSVTIVLLLLNSYSLTAQDWPRVDIAGSGCSAYFPYTPEWSLEFSEDSSSVWVGEVIDGQIFYGIICVEFYEYFMDASEEELILVAEDYLDYLRGEFSIVSHTGYQADYTYESNEYAVGISDSWLDAEGDPWEVKAWIDHFILSVMYMYGDPESFSTENKDYFFNSFWFPD